MADEKINKEAMQKAIEDARKNGIRYDENEPELDFSDGENDEQKDNGRAGGKSNAKPKNE